MLSTNTWGNPWMMLVICRINSDDETADTSAIIHGCGDNIYPQMAFINDFQTPFSSGWGWSWREFRSQVLSKVSSLLNITRVFKFSQSNEPNQLIKLNNSSAKFKIVVSQVRVKSNPAYYPHDIFSTVSYYWPYLNIQYGKNGTHSILGRPLVFAACRKSCQNVDPYLAKNKRFPFEIQGIPPSLCDCTIAIVENNFQNWLAPSTDPTTFRDFETKCRQRAKSPNRLIRIK